MFLLKSQLNTKTRQEIDRILAIPAGQRTTAEAGLLTALAPYLTNRVEVTDSEGNILICAGETVPETGEGGFAKGCLFIKENAGSGTKGLYENEGTATACLFNAIGDISEAEIGNEAVTTGKIADGAVTEAKLASILNLTGKTIDLPTATPINAVASTTVLTSNNTNVTAGKKVVVGSVEYTFVTALSTEPTVANEVLRGATADDTLTNLKKAINLEAGIGTNFSTGTIANPDVSCGTISSHAMTLTAKTKGVAGDEIATTTDETTLSFTGLVLDGGVDGTPGEQFQIVVDDSYLYICIGANTITGNNWRRVSIGSVY